MQYVTPEGIKKPIFDFREYNRDNFSPMCWHFLQDWIIQGMVQVLIEFFGWLIWINVNRNEIAVV